jgi:putative DNA primase/helicase
MGVEAPILNEKKHHPCPWCGGKDRFRFTNKDGTGAFYCGQCGNHSPVDFLMNRRGWDFATAAREIEAVMGDVAAQPAKRQQRDPSGAIKRFWQASEPVVPGDFVDRYLRGRGIVLAQFPPCLRKHPVAEHFNDDGLRTVHPAMLAKLDKPDGAGTNVHRTYLTQSGRKASVFPERKMMAGGVAEGSAVRLFEEFGSTLGIAEGIETALSAAALFDVPVWSGLNTSIMKGWVPPETVERVIVFADRDENFAGQAAAYALASRLAGKKYSVSVQIPERVGDWNDVLIEKKGLAA